jgi:hypothetical protein
MSAVTGNATADPEGGDTEIVLILLSERVCDVDCTNNLGRCDRDCVGSGCPDWSALTVGQQLTLNASHPEGSVYGRRAGEVVFIDQNETHRLVGVACINEPVWVPAPQAELEGNMENLVRYTRLVQMRGTPVRLIVSSWS